MAWYYWVLTSFAYLFFALFMGKFSLQVWHKKISEGFWPKLLYPMAAIEGTLGDALIKTNPPSNNVPLDSIGYRWFTVFALPVRLAWSVIVWFVWSAVRISEIIGKVGELPDLINSGFKRLRSAAPRLPAPATSELVLTQEQSAQIQLLETAVCEFNQKVQALKMESAAKPIDRQVVLERIAQLLQEKTRIEELLQEHGKILQSLPPADPYRGVLQAPEGEKGESKS